MSRQSWGTSKKVSILLANSEKKVKLLKRLSTASIKRLAQVQARMRTLLIMVMYSHGCESWGWL